MSENMTQRHERLTHTKDCSLRVIAPGMPGSGNPSERPNNGPVNYPYPGPSVNHDYSVVAKDLRVDS